MFPQYKPTDIPKLPFSLVAKMRDYFFETKNPPTEEEEEPLEAGALSAEYNQIAFEGGPV